MTKSELRKFYLAKRISLTPDERTAASRRIADNFFNNFDLGSVRFLHCFISIERFNEIDTRPIFERTWNEFPLIQTVVPRVNYETGEMESLTYGPRTEVAIGRWQIIEPAHNEVVEPEEIDIVLVPLVCFDKQGHRVGYGKGYYDRFLKKCRPDCLKIGLSYFEPVGVIPDTHEGDATLDFCLTPDGIVTLLDKNRERQRHLKIERPKEKG